MLVIILKEAIKISATGIIPVTDKQCHIKFVV